MASGDRELKLRLALEYDPAGFGQFSADVTSVQAMAGGASGDLGALASSITSVGTAATGVGQNLSSLSADASGLSGGAAGAEALSGALGDASASAEAAAGSLEGLGGGVEATASSAEAAARGLDGVGTSAETAAGAAEQMSAAEARAAVAQNALAESSKRVTAAETDLVAAIQKHGVGSNEATVATKALVAAEQDHAKAAAAVADSTNQAAAGLGQFSDRTKAVAGGVTAIVAALGVATAAAAEYNQAVTLISTLSGETAARFEEYRTGILSVSQAMGQDAVAGARAAYDALSSGVAADQAVQFLETASKAATAGVTSVDSAGKALTVTMNSFNLTAADTTDVSDAMFAAANVGVTTFDELASSFGGVASIAASSGANYKETLASLAQITTKGASTSQAVTQLKAVFVALSNPMVNAALQARGFADGADAVKKIGLQGVMEAIAEEAKATGTPLIQMVGSSEALNAILASTGDNAEAARSKLDALGSSAGATEAAFQLISETPAQRMKVFESSIQAATISIGDAFLPILGGMLDALTPLVQGFSAFAQNVLVPLGGLFNELPGPIRFTVAALALLVAGGASLITAYALAQPLLASMIPTLFGTGGAAAAAGAASAAGAGGVGLLSSAASTLWAALGPLLPVILAVVGVMSLISAASNKADAALTAQLAKVDQSTAGFNEYAIAAQRAREESGGLAEAGFQWRDGMQDAGDDWVIFKDTVSSALGSVGGALSDAGSSVAEFFGVGGSGVAKAAEDIEVSKGAIIDAGRAFLEMGTNIDPAVLKSEDFRLAQAKLNEQVRDGSLTQDQYQKALLAAANSASVAADKGAVLTTLQVKTRDAFLASSQAVAESGAILSESTLASAEFSAKQTELAEAVAKGALSSRDAKEQWRAYVEQLAAGDTEAQKAIAGNKALVQGFEDLKRGLRDGNISLEDAGAHLQELGTKAGATSEQLTQMAQDLQGLAVPEGFAELGFSLNTEALLDPEKMVEELEAGRAQLADSVSGIFRDQIDARREFQAQEAALADERPAAIAKAEADVAAKIAEVQGKGGDKAGERVAELQAGLAKEVEAINSGNAEKLAALRAGYAQETQDRRDALAQAALDQVNSLLALGKISEDQAFRIFGSLKKASPGSHLFSEEAAATIKFNSTLGQATQGSVEAADALGGLLTNIEGEAEASVAAVEAREQRGIAAVQETNAVVVESADVRAGAYQRQTAAAGEAAASDESANQVRVDSTLGADAVLQASTDARVAMRGTEAQASVVSTDAILTDDGRTVASVEATAGQVESEHARMALARQDAAAASRQSTDGMVGDTTRLGKSALEVGAAVDQSVGRIGGDFIRSGQGVRIGTGEIVAGTADARVALTGLGSDVPGSLAPASAAIKDLGNEAAITGTRIADAAHTRTEGEEDAAGASVRAADDTVEGFSQVAEQSVETAAKVAGLKKELTSLPRKVDIPFTVTGVDKARAAIAQLAKDLKAATGVWSLKIQGSYTGPGPMEPGKSLQLQHDVEDALAAAEPGLHIDGRYTGAGAMAWSGGGLAITESVQAMAAASPERLLLFDPAADAEKLRPLLAEIVRTSAELKALQDASVDAASVVRPALEGIAGALAAFFTNDPAAGGLALILKQLSDLKIELGEDFFRNAGILDVANFQDLQNQLASLASEPKRQEELWKTFIDGLTNKWKVYYDKRSTQLEREKSAQEALRKEALRANKDADTTALDSEIERIEGLLDVLKGQNEDIDFILKEQTFNVGAQFDLYGRLLDATQDRAKAEADAEKARDEALKNAAELLKGLQDSVKDAENDAHEQTMDLLEREQKARERAYKDELARLDALAAATKADVEAQLKAEEEAHQRRLAAITAEADKKDATNEAEQAILDRAKALVDSIRAGNAITAEEAGFLQSLGIDPAAVAETNKELDETAAKLDSIKTLMDKLPAEKGRVRSRGGKLETEAGKELADVSQAERDALQAALAGGKLSKRDRRIAEIFLAGGVVQSERLREILALQVTEEQEKIKEAEKEKDLAGEILDKREKALKVAELAADAQRKAAEAEIALENQRHDAAVAFQSARLEGIDAERDALKQRYDDEKEAIAEAKAAEEERHRARLRQIDEEYALQLLRLGLSDEEVQKKLQEQKDRAAAIADEAQRRFDALLAEAEARRRKEAADRKKMEDEAAAQVAANSGSNVTAPGAPATPPPVQVPPSDPRLPIVPPPGQPGDAAIPFGSVFGGFPDAASSIDSAMTGALGDLKSSAADAGLVIADRLFDPALEQLDTLMARTAQLRDIFAGAPGLFGLTGGGDVTVDHRIVFNGPVTLDRELAEELGILDVARTGAP